LSYGGERSKPNPCRSAVAGERRYAEGRGAGQGGLSLFRH